MSVLAIFSKSSVSLFWLSNPRKKLFFQSVKSFRTQQKARIRCFLQIKKIKKNRATSAQQKPSPHRSPDVNHKPFTLKVNTPVLGCKSQAIYDLFVKCWFWPILAKMGTPKNGEMWFLTIKSCLILKNTNRNRFLQQSVN